MLEDLDLSSIADERAHELVQQLLNVLEDVMAALRAAQAENQRLRDSHLSEGIVRASGRRAQPVVDGWRWFGLKAHARNVRLKADLEMHLSPSAYLLLW